MPIKIRAAEIRDCDRMMELIRELAEYEKAPDAVTVSLDHFQNAGFGKNPVWHALVAETDDGIVGFALWYTRYSTWKGTRLYLEDIIVTDSHRGKGTGRMLFDAVTDEARNRGMTGMMWQVLDWNEPAIRFYNKTKGVRMESGWLNAHLDF